MSDDPAAVAETHSAVVFFFGDRAYKIKKPVRFGFLDFSTRELREAVCHREVELNRRLAPDVYLGVADVVGHDGELCDHMVVMRRMPAARRLTTLVRSGADVNDEIAAVARAVARFHTVAERSASTDAAAARDAVAARWDANAIEMSRFVGSILSEAIAGRVVELAHRYLAGRRALFDLRINEGRARDGHGDLLADDVFCLDDGPRILDCLEFDDRLRHGDVLLDAAFLAMDLEQLGRPDLAARFLACWKDEYGESHPASLEHHYLAHRAQIRSKVGCLRAEQGDPEGADDARRLLDICLRHLERARVRLVLVGGLPGTGKSTLSRAMAHDLDLVLVRSDEVRKELAGATGTDRAVAPYGEGLYTPEHTARTYDALLDRARNALSLGASVVLDASWTDQRWRDRAAELAKATASELVELQCVAPTSVAARRITDRAQSGTDPSDATAEVAAAMAAVADPWPEAITVDTSGSASDSLDVASAAFNRSGSPAPP